MDVEEVVKKVIEKYPEEYRGLVVGGDKVYMGFLVGQVMKETNGMADPRAVHMLIRNQWRK